MFKSRLNVAQLFIFHFECMPIISMLITNVTYGNNWKLFNNIARKTSFTKCNIMTRISE
jgi:hypothetical protein